MKSTSNCDKESLVIFVKAPLPGDVKTRLIPALNPSEAAELYQCFVKDIVRSMQQIKGVTVQLAYQPHAKTPNPSWTGFSLPYFRQEGQSLGERLYRALTSAFQDRAKRVVIIGSDSPTLPTTYVAQAFRMLKQCDVVLGPATDGGYYLVGMSRLCPNLFDQVSWSTEEVFGRTFSNAQKYGYSLRTLPAYFDIDTVQDLESFWKDRDSNKVDQMAPLTGRYLARILNNKRRFAFA